MVKKSDYQQRNANQGNFQNHGPKVHFDNNVNRSAEHSTERNMNRSPERSSVEKSMERSNERNVERSNVERSPDRNIERNVSRSPERTVEHNTNHSSTDRGVERNAGRSPEHNTDRNMNRDNRQFRGYTREAPIRHNYSGQNPVAKYNIRAKADESVEDIKADIVRIEKEIELEIREIKSMRLGL